MLRMKALLKCVFAVCTTTIIFEIDGLLQGYHFINIGNIDIAYDVQYDEAIIRYVIILW